MNLEELDKNDYRYNEYWYKYLLRNIKNLDSVLTKYLVGDFYHYNSITKDNIIDEIQNINDITNFILDGIKEQKENNEEEYKNYFIGDTNEAYKDRARQFDAWRKLLEIIEILNKQNNKNKINISFNKGYDFGPGYTNFCSIKIFYLATINNCTYSKQIMEISTTSGKIIDLYTLDTYYEILYPNIDKIQRQNMLIKARQEFDNKNDVIEAAQALIDEFLEKINKEDE